MDAKPLCGLYELWASAGLGAGGGGYLPDAAYLTVYKDASALRRLPHPDLVWTPVRNNQKRICVTLPLNSTLAPVVRATGLKLELIRLA